MSNKLEQFAALLSDRKEREYEKWFDEIAEFLMNHLCLEVGKTRYRITECEFYYNDQMDESHKDVYTHGEIEQQSFCNLYLNKVGGLDITFGKSNIYAGILIRGIRNIEKQDEYISYVTGITREVFRSLGNIITEVNGIQLKELLTDSFEIESPIKTKRARLKFNEDDKKDYLNKKYRYIIELKPSHKFFDKENLVRDLIQTNEYLHKDPKEILGYELPKKSK